MRPSFSPPGPATPHTTSRDSISSGSQRRNGANPAGAGYITPTLGRLPSAGTVGIASAPRLGLSFGTTLQDPPNMSARPQSSAARPSNASALGAKWQRHETAVESLRHRVTTDATLPFPRKVASSGSSSKPARVSDSPLPLVTPRSGRTGTGHPGPKAERGLEGIASVPFRLATVRRYRRVSPTRVMYECVRLSADHAIALHPAGDGAH